MTHDPWRYACPSCGSVSIKANVQSDQHGEPAATRYRCPYCDWTGSCVFDKKTGDRRARV